MAHTSPPKRRAVALEYKDSEKLPTVLASGAGDLAEAIIRLAQKNNIPVHKDSSLVDLLAAVDIGATISPETYRLVAEVVCFLYQVDEKWRLAHPGLHSVGELALLPPPTGVASINTSTICPTNTGKALGEKL